MTSAAKTFPMMNDKCPTCGRSDRKIRSTNQSSYYWAVIIKMISDDTGNDPESVHNALKTLFLPREFIQIGEKEVEVAKSTKDLTTVEMETFLTRCRVFAGQELNITLPLPNEAPL